MKNTWIWIFPVLQWSVTDGDTIKITLDRGFGASLRVKLRVSGVDTPEPRGGNNLTRSSARLATNSITRWLGKAEDIKFRSDGKLLDKYGRALGDLLLDGRSLAQRLIEERLGIPYHGGSRDDVLAAHEGNAEWLQEQGLLED